MVQSKIKHTAVWQDPQTRSDSLIESIQGWQAGPADLATAGPIFRLRWCCWPLACRQEAHMLPEHIYPSFRQHSNLQIYNETEGSTGYLGRAWASPTLLYRVHQPTDWPTNCVRPITWYRYVAHAHAVMLCHHATLMHVNSADPVCSGDSYKTEDADDGKTKSRDTHAMNCEGGMRERPANLFILALPCRCRHASLAFTCVSLSRQSLYTVTPFFTLSYISTTCAHHSGQDLRAHVIHTGVYGPHPLT